MQTLTAHELKAKQLRGDDFTLINTLSNDHFEETHVPNSINIPLEEKRFVERVEEATGGKDKEVVLYCASAECPSSTKAAETLEQNGFSHVIDFETGAKGWQDAGMSLEGQNA